MLYKHKQTPNFIVEILDSTSEDVRYQDITTNNISIIGKKSFDEMFELMVPLKNIQTHLSISKRVSLILFILGGSIVNALYSIVLFANEQESAQLCVFNLFSCGVVTFLYNKAVKNSLTY